MFITLLVVPVLFVIAKSRMLKTSSAALTALLIAGLVLVANPALARTQRLTLPEAVELALDGNSAVKIARLKVEEKEKKVDSTSANYYPRLSNDLHLTP
jgi:outer membrane protein TolC